MPRMTIQQIAELAGVNKATVSRVINGNANISEQTRRKVEAIMKQYNYVPNSMARGLAFNKTFTVGFCFDYTNKQAHANPFFYKVLQGIEEVVYANDHLFLMMSDHQDRDRQSAFERIVVEHRVDGLIIPSTVFNERTYRLLIQHNLPFVVTGQNTLIKEGVRWVDIDNVQAGQILTEHLMQAGYRNILMYAGQETVRRDKFVADRLQGYRQTMEQHRLKAQVLDRADRGELAELLASDEPKALICCTHEQLLEILDMEPDSREDASFTLATFDDFPMSGYLKYPVRYVEVDLELMGRTAAKMLFALMNKEEHVPQFVSIQTRIGTPRTNQFN